VKKRTFAWKRVLLTITAPIWVVPLFVLCLIATVVIGIAEAIKTTFEWVFPKTPEYEQYLYDKGYEEREEQRRKEMQDDSR